MVDLDSDSWPVIRLPYLNSIHSSAITCSQHVSNVPDQLWQKIIDAGESQNKGFSLRVSKTVSGYRILVQKFIFLLSDSTDGSSDSLGVSKWHFLLWMRMKGQQSPDTLWVWN